MAVTLNTSLNSEIQQGTTESVRNPEAKVSIDWSLYQKLNWLGIIPCEERSYNVGASDYSKHIIQPWAIWLEYPDLTSWDHDIIKRVLRTKSGESRESDYEKIIHDCEERLRQLKFSRNENSSN